MATQRKKVNILSFNKFSRAHSIIYLNRTLSLIFFFFLCDSGHFESLIIEKKKYHSKNNSFLSDFGPIDNMLQCYICYQNEGYWKKNDRHLPGSLWAKIERKNKEL